jgi:hypothetical protein
MNTTTLHAHPFHKPPVAHAPLTEQDIEELNHSQLWADAKTRARDNLGKHLTFDGSPLHFAIREFACYVDIAPPCGPGMDCSKLLLNFVRHQGEMGQIPDLYEKNFAKGPGEASPDTDYTETARRFGNAIIQESCLIQAICSYISGSGDMRFLSEIIHGKTLINHLSSALDFLWSEHFSSHSRLLGTPKRDCTPLTTAAPPTRQPKTRPSIRSVPPWR